MILSIRDRKTGKIKGTIDIPDGTSREEEHRLIREKFNVEKDREIVDRQDAPPLLKRLGSQFRGGQEDILGATSRLLGIKPQETEPVREAAGIPEHLARFAGEMTAPIGGVPGAGVPGAIGRAFAASPAYPPIRKAVLGTAGAIRRGGAAIGGIGKEGVYAQGNILASIPPEHFKLAVEKNIFKGKGAKVADKEFQSAGELAQDAMNLLGKERAKQVGKADTALAKIPDMVEKKDLLKRKTNIFSKKEGKEFSPLEYISKVEKIERPLIGERYGEISKLSKKDLIKAALIKRKLRESPTIKTIKSLKKTLDDFPSSPRMKIEFDDIADDFKYTVDKMTAIKTHTLISPLREGGSISPINYLKKIEKLERPFKRGEVDLLTQKDRKQLAFIKDTLKKNPKVIDIQDLKKSVDDFISYNNEGVIPASKRGRSLFRGIADDLRNTIAKLSPDLAEANIKSHEIQTLRDELGKTFLKNKTVTKKFKNLESQEPYTLGLLEQLDKISPEKYKFMDKTKELLARKSFEPWFPGRGGGSGGPQGFANINRALLGTGRALMGMAAVPAVPLMSPRIQQKLLRGGIRGAAGVRRGVAGVKRAAPYVSPLIKRAVTRKLIKENAPEKNQDGTFSNNFKRQLVRDDPRRRI